MCGHFIQGHLSPPLSLFFLDPGPGVWCEGGSSPVHSENQHNKWLTHSNDLVGVCGEKWIKTQFVCITSTAMPSLQERYHVKERPKVEGRAGGWGENARVFKERKRGGVRVIALRSFGAIPRFTEPQRSHCPGREEQISFETVKPSPLPHTHSQIPLLPPKQLYTNWFKRCERSPLGDVASRRLSRTDKEAVSGKQRHNRNHYTLGTNLGE